MLAEYTSLAMLLPVSTLVGYGIGYALDRLFGTSFLYIPFLVLGTVAGLMQVIRQLLRDAHDDEQF
jgi:F0F1-type ATP synthase assembly protein I